MEQPEEDAQRTEVTCLAEHHDERAEQPTAGVARLPFARKQRATVVEEREGVTKEQRERAPPRHANEQGHEHGPLVPEATRDDGEAAPGGPHEPPRRAAPLGQGLAEPARNASRRHLPPPGSHPSPHAPNVPSDEPVTQVFGILGSMLLALALLTSTIVGAAESATSSRNVWALAGAQSWRPCIEAARDAEAGRFDALSGAQGRDGRGWRTRAEACPNEPWVRVMAAREGLLESARLDGGVEAPENLERWVAQHRRLLQRVLRDLEAAEREATRRGEAPPRQTSYWRAYALFASGAYGEARTAWHEAYRAREVERWRLDRMGALLDVQEGKLSAAVRRARLSWTDVGHDERLISGYVWALVLDRVGSPGGARDALVALRREGAHVMARRSLEGLLPVHERLYLQALDHHADGDGVNAIRLWTAYLQRPEPIEADRELARRHLRELQPRPPLVGGA